MMPVRGWSLGIAVVGLLSGCASTSGGGGLPTGLPSGLPDSGTGAPSLPSPPSPPSAPGAPSLPSPSSSPGGSPGGVPTGKSDESSGRRDGTAEGETASGSAGTESGTTQGSAGTGDAKTAEERRAEIDARLDASLGGFDEQLGKEQQATAQQRDARGTGRGSMDDDAGMGEGQSGNEVSRDRSGDLRSDGAQTAKNGDAEAGERGSAMPSGGGGAAARAIPSGEDDDIIARRLRKAAEEETDPELKEKLWNEYRDYKQNTRGGGT